MWWEVLGVSYDADLRTIKKAYAKLIKEVKPDEDSEAFIRVQKAYKAAKEHHQEKPDQFVPPKTKGDKVHILEMRDMKLEVESEFERFPMEPESENNKKEENTEIPKVTFPLVAMEERASVLDRFLILYRDIEKRTHIKYWNKFFSDLNLLEEVTLGETLIFLMETHRVFSKSVWEHIYSYIKEDAQNKSDFFHKLNEFYPDFSFTIQVDDNLDQLLKYYEVRHQLYEYALGLRDSIDQESFLEVMSLSMQDRENLHLFSEYSRENKIASFFEMYEGLYSYEHYDLITTRVHQAEYYRENGNRGHALSLYKILDSGIHMGIYSKLGLAKCEGHYFQTGFPKLVEENYKSHVFMKNIYHKEINKVAPIVTPKTKFNLKYKFLSKYHNMGKIEKNSDIVFGCSIVVILFLGLYIIAGIPVKIFTGIIGVGELKFWEDFISRCMVFAFVVWLFNKYSVE